MNRLPDSVERRQNDGQFERVAVRRVAVGDVIRVHPARRLLQTVLSWRALRWWTKPC